MRRFFCITLLALIQCVKPDVSNPYSVGDKSFWQRQEFLCLTGQLDLCKPPTTSVPTAQVASLPTPSAPVLSAGNTQNTLTWSTVSGATSYNLVFKTSAGVTKSNGTILTSVTSPYTHSGLANNSTYYYVVVAKSDTAESDVSPEASATPICSPCRIYITSASYSGALGGIAGADTICGTDANKPSTPANSVYKALLADTPDRVACTSFNCGTNGSSENINWVLKPNRTYIRASDSVTIATTSSAAVWTTHTDLIQGGPITLYSGMNPGGWNIAINPCSHWTLNTGNTAPTCPSNAFASGCTGAGSCVSNKFACVEQ